MAFLTKLLGAGAADAVTALGGALDELVTSDEERTAAATVMEAVRQRPQLAQIAIGQANAANPNWFVSGGRPALVWVAATGLFFFYVPQYVIASFLWARQCLMAGDLVAYPVSPDGLLELVALAIGMSGIRSFDKMKGKAR